MTDLQQELYDIRDRAALIAASESMLDRVDDLELSQADVPRLLAAVEEVLDTAGVMTRCAQGVDYWGGVRAAADEILAAITDKLTGGDDE